jgi:hypothetical protein
MSTMSITPKDIKPIVEKRWQIEHCYGQSTVKSPPSLAPTPQRAEPKQRKTKSKKMPVYLTKQQHAELKRGHIPKGVDWRNVKLSRRQKGLLRAARQRTLRAESRTTALVLA